MSILLDALKKSEEQRRLGETPGLHSPVDHDPDTSRKGLPRWVWLLAAVLLAVAVAWFAWSRLGSGSPSLVESSAITAAPASSSRPAVSDQQPDQQPADRGDRSEPQSRTPVEDYRPNNGPAVGQAPDNPAAELRKRRDLNRSFNEFKSPGQDASVAALAEPEAESGLDSTAPRKPDSMSEPHEPRPRTPDPIRFWELPQNVRSGLPEVKISVIVYADDPADRFLLINGQRMQEGDSLSGMVLDEIRRDGAVFRYRNYRFLVEG